MSVQNINSLFCTTSSVDISSTVSIQNARNTLDEIAEDLAKDVYLRQRMGQSEPSLWPVLHHLWQTVAEAQENERYEVLIRPLIPSLAKFTRNLVAAVAYNQSHAFEDEPRMRKLLFASTSFRAFQDESTFPATAVLAQTISNMVTSNEELLPRFWHVYMNLPEEQSILTRMLGSPDTRTILSALVLILNCIHDSRSRASLFITSPIGLRACITLLDRMVTLHDIGELSGGGKAFEIGYSIFSRIIDFRLLPDLYTGISVVDEIITPHQTVLLKLLDSYLQTSSLTVETCRQLSPMIASTFFDLAKYADLAIDRALPPELSPLSASPPSVSSPGTPSTAPPATPITSQSPPDIYLAPTPADEVGSRPVEQMATSMGELDMLLPQSCEALVLLTQCLIALALTSEDPDFGFPDGDNPRDFFNSATMEDRHGLVEVLIGLLRRLDRFLPRILFGKSVDLSSLPLPAGARHPEYPGSNATENEEGGEGEGPAKKGFAYLKRDLVRLIGVLCARDTAVQNRVRLCGGIPIIMNLCVVDERNPYLREHAIFALHNLLEGNVQNQAAVNEVQPIGSADDGSVRD